MSKDDFFEFVLKLIVFKRFKIEILNLLEKALRD